METQKCPSCGTLVGVPVDYKERWLTCDCGTEFAVDRRPTMPVPRKQLPEPPRYEPPRYEEPRYEPAHHEPPRDEPPPLSRFATAQEPPRYEAPPEPPPFRAPPEPPRAEPWVQPSGSGAAPRPQRSVAAAVPVADPPPPLMDELLESGPQRSVWPAVAIVIAVCGLVGGGIVIGSLLVKGSNSAEQAVAGTRAPLGDDSTADDNTPGKPKPPEFGVPPAGNQTGEGSSDKVVHFSQPLLVTMVLNGSELFGRMGSRSIWLKEIDPAGVTSGQTVSVVGGLRYQGTKTYVRPNRGEWKFDVYSGVGDVTFRVLAVSAATGTNREPEQATPRRENTPGARSSSDDKTLTPLEPVEMLIQIAREAIAAGKSATARSASQEARRQCEAIIQANANSALVAAASAKLVEIDRMFAGMDRAATAERPKLEPKPAVVAAVKAYLAQLTHNPNAFEVLSVGEPELRKVRNNNWQLTTIAYVRFRALNAARRVEIIYWIFAVKDGAVIQTCATTNQTEMFGGSSLDH